MATRLIAIALLFATFSAVAQEKKYMIVFLNSKPDSEKISPEETKTIMEGHMANMARLAKENKLLAAGPFHGGGGIFIMNSGSVSEAEECISTAPGVQAKRWRIEILPFQPRVGGICPVGDDYEMTTYTFYRFDAVASKFTIARQSELIDSHDKYLHEIANGGNVVTEAVFGPRDGGILILKGEVDADLMNTDPAVEAGLVEVQRKNLYIAKGSFCEE